SEALNADKPPARSRAVQQAIELMRSHPARPWSSADLARGAAVSVRSLQEAFRRSVGMPPMAYLREIRLERARQEFSTATEATTVTEVAGHWGFVHFGRFAAAY